MPLSMWKVSEKLGRKQTTDLSLDVQGNYPNFRQKLAEKKILSFQAWTKASRCLVSAVSDH